MRYGIHFQNELYGIILYRSDDVVLDTEALQVNTNNAPCVLLAFVGVTFNRKLRQIQSSILSWKGY